MKATITACANLALIKYWGNSDDILNLPINDSISVSLEALQTTTTIEFSENHSDTIELNGQQIDEQGLNRFKQVLDFFRKTTNFNTPVKIISRNNFPTSAGIASSASGFGALAHALYEASDIDYNRTDVSSLARIGSGSASRTIISGFAHWQKGNSHENSFASQILAPNDMKILIIITSKVPKSISSKSAMLKSKTSSPFFKQRGDIANSHIPELKDAIINWNFEKVGNITQKEANNLHAVINTTDLGIYYWNETTINIIHKIKDLQDRGHQVYYTIDAGPQVKILLNKDEIELVTSELKSVNEIQDIIISNVGFGSKPTNEHFF